MLTATGGGLTGGSLNRTSCKLSPAAERELPSCLLASESIICKRPVSMGSGKKLILCERLRDREDCGGDRRNKTSTKKGGRVSFNGGGGLHSSGLNIMSKLSRSLGEMSGQIRTRVAASLRTFLSIIRTSIACNVTGSESTGSFVEGLRTQSRTVRGTNTEVR